MGELGVGDGEGSATWGYSLSEVGYPFENYTLPLLVMGTPEWEA